MPVYFKLYQGDGVTLQYVFPTVFEANYPHSEKEMIEHKSIRGKGSLYVDGGEVAWDLTLRGVVFGENYDAVITAIEAMESDVVINTPYILKITKSILGGTNYEYNVKRVTPIQYQIDNIRTDYLEYTIQFRVNAW
jgi:hypothetical protein